MTDLSFAKEKLNNIDEFRHKVPYKVEYYNLEINEDVAKYLEEKINIYGFGKKARNVKYRLRKFGNNSHNLGEYFSFIISGTYENTAYFYFNIKCKKCNLSIIKSYEVKRWSRVPKWDMMHKEFCKKIPGCEEVMMEAALE